MSKRPGLARAREMNEIEAGMKYCRKAECGEYQKGLNISYLEVNQTESGQESMSYTFLREPNRANVQREKQVFRELNSRYER